MENFFQTKFTKNMVIRLSVFLGLFISIALLIFSSHNDFELTRTKRAQTSESIYIALEAQKGIAQEFENGTPLNDIDMSRYIKKGKYMNYMQITQNAEIITHTDIANSFTIFKPTVSGNKITWACKGSPQKYMSGACQNDL